MAYENGLRLFELDFSETSDGYLVASHDWDKWKQATGLAVGATPSLEQFKETLLFGRYHGVDLIDLNKWFRERPDAYLVTDKTTNFKKLVEGFSHGARLIVEIGSVDQYRRAVEEGVQYPMLSLASAYMDDGEDKVLELLETYPVKFVAIPTIRMRRHRELLAKLRRNKTCVYAFTSNDPAYMQREFRRTIYGVYTDHWNVASGACDAQGCDTY